MESLCVKDRSYVLSPTSTTSSSEEVEMTSAFEIQRSKLNAFLAECRIHPLEKPWLEWANVGERTQRRYIQRASEIISSVLKGVYPGNPGCLWSQLQSSTAINEMLGDEATCSPSDRSYLEGLAKPYKNGMGHQKANIICHGRHRKLQSNITFHSWDNAVSLHYGQLISSPIW